MVDKAIIFAVEAHKGQLRKGTQLPYIVHPMEVFAIVSRMTQDKEILAAAILHDTIEDCKQVKPEQIRDLFGERVLHLIQKETEDKRFTWEQRKGHTIQQLSKEEDEATLMIALGDKLANIRSLVQDYQQEGEEVWQRFRMKDKKMQGWYYKGLCDSLKVMKDHAEYKEFCSLVSEVFD